MRVTSTRKSLYFVTFSACFLAMLPSTGQLISIRRQVFASYFGTDVRTIGTALPSSREGCIRHHSNVIHLHKPIRMMPVPSALHWNPKMTTNVSVDNGGHLIVSISVVHRCQSTTACHNVVNCFHAYTAQAASGTDISVQNVALIIPSSKSLVLSTNNQFLSCSRKIHDFSHLYFISCPQVVS